MNSTLGLQINPLFNYSNSKEVQMLVSLQQLLDLHNIREKKLTKQKRISLSHQLSTSTYYQPLEYGDILRKCLIVIRV